MQRVNRWFPALTIVTLTAPAVAGGLLTWSWWGALTAFFWAGLVRVAVLHHVTWSVNSLCHMIGERPYAARDKSANFWPLAIASMGESWHNSHHADPTGARHGVRRGQLDMSASYNVTDTFTLSLDVYNLTDSSRFEFENDRRVSRWVDYDGRTYTLTARATF